MLSSLENLIPFFVREDFEDIKIGYKGHAK